MEITKNINHKTGYQLNNISAVIAKFLCKYCDGKITFNPIFAKLHVGNNHLEYVVPNIDAMSNEHREKCIEDLKSLLDTKDSLSYILNTNDYDYIGCTLELELSDLWSIHAMYVSDDIIVPDELRNDVNQVMSNIYKSKFYKDSFNFESGKDYMNTTIAVMKKVLENSYNEINSSIKEDSFFNLVKAYHRDIVATHFTMYSNKIHFEEFTCSERYGYRHDELVIQGERVLNKHEVEFRRFELSVLSLAKQLNKYRPKYKKHKVFQLFFQTIQEFYRVKFINIEEDIW